MSRLWVVLVVAVLLGVSGCASGRPVPPPSRQERRVATLLGQISDVKPAGEVPRWGGAYLDRRDVLVGHLQEQGRPEAAARVVAAGQGLVYAAVYDSCSSNDARVVVVGDQVRQQVTSLGRTCARAQYGVAVFSLRWDELPPEFTLDGAWYADRRQVS